MAKLSKLSVATGASGSTKTYVFLGNAEFYTGAVATATGISPTIQEDLDEPVYSVAQLLGSGILIRLNATAGTLTNPKNVRFLSRIDKLPDALKLKDAATPAGTLRSPRVARKSISY